MIPRDWKRSTLGECSKFISGKTPSKEILAYWAGDYPWVTAKDMKTIFLNEAILGLTPAGKAIAAIAPAQSILILTRGMTLLKDLPVCVVMRDMAFKDIKAIVPIPGVDPHFLAYQLIAKKSIVLNLVDTAGHGTGRLDTDLLKSVDISLPPLIEQRRVAQILATWDHAIETTERLLANSRTQKQQLANTLLDGRRRLGGNTDRWTHADFDVIFERVTRKNTVGNIKVLTISGEHGLICQRDYFNKSVASANLSGYTLLSRGEFAYNKSYSKGYPMGAIKPLTNYEAGVVSSLYLCFRLRKDVDACPDFFRHYFEAGHFNQVLEGIAQEGARNHGLLNVSVVDFFKLRLRVPSAPEQRQIAQVINVAEAEERTFATQLNLLQAEKVSLMQQLLSGKRRVQLFTPKSQRAA